MNNGNKPNRTVQNISVDQKGSVLTLSHSVWFHKPVNYAYQTSKFKLLKKLLSLFYLINLKNMIACSEV